MKLKIKDQIPNTEIFHLVDGEPKKSNLREILGNGKIILFGLKPALRDLSSSPAETTSAPEPQFFIIFNIAWLEFALTA